MKTPQSINANIVAIVTGSTLLQCIALLGVLPIAANTLGRQLFSTVEMSLVLLLLLQSWRIRQWSVETAQNALVQNTARLCFYSLLLCGIGDFVNRNYFEQYYQWDAVIKHGYLIHAIGFFFPGYLLIALANWRLGRAKVGRRAAVIGIVVAGALGTLAFLDSYNPHVSPYASSAMWLYTLLHAVLAVSALWLIKTYGWSASCIVVIGVLLAPMADVLIAQFWIYQDHFPLIEHVNWILYFTSLAMIQQLPFLAARDAIAPGSRP